MCMPRADGRGPSKTLDLDDGDPFVRSCVSGPSRPDTHPQAPKRRAWEALTGRRRSRTAQDGLFRFRFRALAASRPDTHPQAPERRRGRRARSERVGEVKGVGSPSVISSQVKSFHGPAPRSPLRPGSPTEPPPLSVNTSTKCARGPGGYSNIIASDEVVLLCPVLLGRDCVRHSGGGSGGVVLSQRSVQDRMIPVAFCPA